MQIPLANIHWHFLLVRDDWGFQVNPLCHHLHQGTRVTYVTETFSVAVTDFHQLEKMRGKETCRALLLFCRHTRNHPHSFSLTARIIHSRVISREHQAELDCGY